MEYYKNKTKSNPIIVVFHSTLMRKHYIIITKMKYVVSCLTLVKCTLYYVQQQFFLFLVLSSFFR